MGKCIFTKPITIREANQFVKLYHRHHRPTSNNSWKWALSALNQNGELVWVLIAWNPVSATYMDWYTLEITRLCVSENAPLWTASFLLARAKNIWKIMWGKKLLTYTLVSESGASLRWAGRDLKVKIKWHKKWESKSKYDWKIRDNLEIYKKEKWRWEILLCN